MQLTGTQLTMSTPVPRRCQTCVWHKHVHTSHASAEFTLSRLSEFPHQKLISGTLQGPVKRREPALASP